MSQTATVPAFIPTAMCRHCDSPVARFNGDGQWIDESGTNDCRSGLGLAEGHDVPPVLTPSDCRPVAPFPSRDVLKNDIPYSVAAAAHAGTSFVPETRAEQERSSYASQLALDYDAMAKYATTDEKRATLDAEFQRYRAGYRQRYLAMLSARSRCMSTMITGGSNFPVARQAKRNEYADTRIRELGEYRERALDAIRKALRPELRPVMAGDNDAAERLTEKISKAEELQARMKSANDAIRKHKKAGEAAQVAALVALGFNATMAGELLKPDFCGRIGFASYQLTNNNANIRRMKERLAQISTAKATPDVQADGDHAKLEDSPADNRVRLFFPGKPSAEVRTRLKSAGFRWAPSLGCWQAYRNYRTLAVASKEAGIRECVLPGRNET